jgi:hypothetical protein
MKSQKFLIIDDVDRVNEWLEKGWEVVSVTPQYVSVSMTGSSYNYKTEVGKFAVVIQKVTQI